MTILLPENAVSVTRGTSKTLVLTVKDKEGDPVNLTGATIYFSVKRDEEDVGNPLIQKISTNSTEIEIPNPTDGIAKIYLQPSDTQNFDVTQYKFDVWMVSAIGKRFVVVKTSIFNVEAAVTRIPL
jgi:hypothetical protein